MKRIVIIGCGFGGAAALRRLRSSRVGAGITVIDRKETLDFLPMLPDVIGREVDPALLQYPIRRLERGRGFKFVPGEVTAVDPDKKKVLISGGEIDYDYLIIASGSQTNFYGDGRIENIAYKLDSAADAEKMGGAVREKRFKAYVVAGGGYTGIEIATNIRLSLRKGGSEGRVVIAERAPSILAPLPDWMKRYVSENLKKMDIDVMAGTTVEPADGGRVRLSNGGELDGAMLIWTAGVRTPDFVQNAGFDKAGQGRLVVDEYLRTGEGSFAVGDTAAVNYADGILRMGVQFAITQGEMAASNIVRSINGTKLRRYEPRDLGYMVPLANNDSCGTVLGYNIRGRMATFMHYMMCVYRACGMKNKAGIVRELVF